MTICFGRFDSEISNLKKTHTTDHGDSSYLIGLRRASRATLDQNKNKSRAQKMSTDPGCFYVIALLRQLEI